MTTEVTRSAGIPAVLAKVDEGPKFEGQPVAERIVRKDADPPFPPPPTPPYTPPMPTCPSCGEDNVEGARFCSACGAPLSETPQVGEARKRITVVFSDVVGSTALGERTDPEALARILRTYYQRMKAVIERHGGRVEKFIGDAVLGAFGVPVAHEDDALRAVRAASEMRQELSRVNEELQSRWGVRIEARTGVNTGEVLVGAFSRGENFGVGAAMSLGARLEQHASPGEILLGEATWDLVREGVKVEALAPVEVRGREAPVRAYRLLAVLPGAEAIPRRMEGETPRASTPFVGREEDLALLQMAYRRAVREGSLQLVTVSGEPGVGKTRLVGEFSRSVDTEPGSLTWRQGRCLPYGEGITFWALGEILKAQAGILESDPAAVARDKLQAAVEAVIEEPSEQGWFLERLSALISANGGASPTDRSESFTAWRRFLEAVASRAPLVIVVEDLHWADEPMLAFVEHLVEYCAGVPILLVCTARPELYERRPAWGGGTRNATAVALAPLTEAETATLVGALLSRALLPETVQAGLLERSGGNPLYAEEFVRMLADRGMLQEGASAPTGQEAELPTTLHALIAARLDTLSPERKHLLQDAAVLGKVFWSGAVASMGHLEEAEVMQGLHELVRKELIRSHRHSSMAHQSEYAFWHALVRDVAYGEIPRATRGAKHRAAAEWIESIGGEDPTADHAEILAYHYTQALELLRDSGEQRPRAPGSGRPSPGSGRGPGPEPGRRHGRGSLPQGPGPHLP